MLLLLAMSSPLPPPPCGSRSSPATMKAPARLFRLSDWYGDDWDHKKPIGDAAWVSPWAKAHFKLRQQEIEIEQCEFLLSAAVEAEDYAEAGGLQTRVERLRSQHPIIPREERLAEALEDGNYELAAIFQQDLDAVKTNLGLPKFVVGQAVEHSHREGLRGTLPHDRVLVPEQLRDPCSVPPKRIPRAIVGLRHKRITNRSTLRP